MINGTKEVTLTFNTYCTIVGTKEVPVCGDCLFVKDRFLNLSFSYGCSYLNVPLVWNDTQGYLIPNVECPLHN